MIFTHLYSFMLHTEKFHNNSRTEYSLNRCSEHRRAFLTNFVMQKVTENSFKISANFRTFSRFIFEIQYLSRFLQKIIVVTNF